MATKQPTRTGHGGAFCKPAPERLKQKDNIFKDSLGYIASSRPTGLQSETLYLLFEAKQTKIKKKKKKKTETQKPKTA
jgi:hypothetical protein